jgi:hypothetical protein
MRLAAVLHAAPPPLRCCHCWQALLAAAAATAAALLLLRNVKALVTQLVLSIKIIYLCEFGDYKWAGR